MANDKPSSSEPRRRLPPGAVAGAILGFVSGLALLSFGTVILVALTNMPGYGHVPTWDESWDEVISRYTVAGVMLPLLCCTGAGAVGTMGLAAVLAALRRRREATQ